MPTVPYYPEQVINFGAEVVNFTTTILAEHVNMLRAEVNSIEGTLGTYLTTSSGWVGVFDTSTAIWNSTKDRLANIEYGLKSAYDAMTPDGGTSGQILQKNSSSDYDFSWVTFTGLPTQSGGTTGQFLTSNGSAASWASISQVPAQSAGTTGQYLTSDGSTASWGTVTQSSGGANEFVLMMMGA